MEKKSTSTFAQVTEPTKALSQVVKERKIVRGMVKESGDELASVNLVLNEEFSNRNLQPEVEIALEKSEAVEVKVSEASEKLSQVN